MPHSICVKKRQREVKAATVGRDEKSRVKMERRRRREKWVNNWRPPERVCTQLSADSPLGPQVASSLRYCQLERGKMGRRKEEWKTGIEWWKAGWNFGVGNLQMGFRQTCYLTEDKIYCVKKKYKGKRFVFSCLGICFPQVLVKHVGLVWVDREAAQRDVENK